MDGPRQLAGCPPRNLVDRPVAELDIAELDSVAEFARTSDQDGALRPPWADPCAGLRPWGPRLARAGSHAIVPLIMAGHPVLDIAVFLGASSFPLPATAWVPALVEDDGGDQDTTP